MREDGKRNFALVDRSGEEFSAFSGATPRQAAVEAARRLEPTGEKGQGSELRILERETGKVHIYEVWAWEEEAPNNSPDWMPDKITETNVSKEGIERLEEI